MEHDFYLTRLAGNVVCSRCKLMPLDDDDFDTTCEEVSE